LGIEDDNTHVTSSKSRATGIVISIVAGLAAGVATAVTIMLVGAAIFWVYLFGDDTWPSSAEAALTITAYVGGVLVFLCAVLSQVRARR
jgi:hypothetical protein